MGDLDNDGRMDVVVSVLNGPAKLFHNITQTNNHWILLQLRGKTSNRMGIGAQIKLTTPDGAQQFNEVTTSVGYASSSDSRVHFGLGASTMAGRIDIAARTDEARSSCYFSIESSGGPSSRRAISAFHTQSVFRHIEPGARNSNQQSLF